MPPEKGCDPKRDPDRRPASLRVEPDGIPEELRALDQWVRWRWTWDVKRGAWTKVPIRPRTNEKASSTEPSTWGSMREALAGLGRNDTHGVGFVFTPRDPYCGIDIDACRHPETGVVSPPAMEIVTALDGYAEVSASGTGIHVIVRAVLPGHGRKKGNLEIYDRGRYFAMTGIGVGSRHAN